jgi:hypothetical protein
MLISEAKQGAITSTKSCLNYSSSSDTLTVAAAAYYLPFTDKPIEAMTLVLALLLLTQLWLHFTSYCLLSDSLAALMQVLELLLL